MTAKYDSSETSITMLSNDFFAPTSTQAVFWHPRYDIDTPLALYAPFLFWITAATRPRKIAVVGGNDGYAHFLFCQAIDKVNLPSKVSGLALGEEMDDCALEVAQHQLNFYEPISDLRTAPSFAHGAWLWREQSIDLLFIDLAKLREGDQEALEYCLSVLNQSGMILLYGTQDKNKLNWLDTVVSRLAAGARCVDLTFGAGVKVIAKGALAPQLNGLFESSENGQVSAKMALVFRRIGQSLITQHKLKTLEQTVLSCSSETPGQVMPQDSQDLARQELQSVKAQFEAEILAHASRTEEQKKNIESLTLALATAKKQLTEAQSQFNKEAAALKDQANASAHKRFEETAVLTRMLETLKKNHQALQKEAKRLRARNSQLLSSRSWKITAPLRLLGRYLTPLMSPIRGAKHNKAKSS